jgi:hypothetical protein
MRFDPFSTSARRRACRVLPLGVAALAIGSPARADDPPLAFSPGLSVVGSFGPRLSLGALFDLRASHLLSQDFSRGESGAGPYLQVGWLSSGWRVGAGLHVGTEVGFRKGAVDFELGWTFREAYPPYAVGAHGFQFGVLGFIQPRPPPLSDTGSQAPAVELSARGILFVQSPITEDDTSSPSSGPGPSAPADEGPFPIWKPELLLGAGVRYPWVFDIASSGGGGGTLGRPLRWAGHALPASTVRVFQTRAGESRRSEGRAPGGARLDAETRFAIAEAWLQDAREECASIPAFVALARDLATAGAPAALVRRALVAARDECRHTEHCAALAAGYGIDAVLEPPAPPPAADADRRSALLRMATEAWMDGCLGEGSAANRAALAASFCESARSRAVLSGIASDEARHAELAWSVLAFCLAAGGSEVRDALATALASDAAPPASAPLTAGARLRAHGRLSPQEADAVWRSTSLEARVRARQLLSRGDVT